MDTVLHQEEQNRKKGWVTTIIFHILLLILCILPLLTFPDPPPGQPSVAISFGAPEVGQGEEEPAPAPPVEETKEVEEPAEVEEIEDVVEEREVKEEEKKPEKPKETKPEKDNAKKLADESRARKLAEEKKKKDAAAKKAKEKARKEAAAKKAKADAAKKAKAEAAAKAAAAAKAKEEAKNKFKDVFSGGQGSGDDSQGNSGTPGNAGVEDGKPDATVLSGEGTGNGDVSGFGDRGYTPAGPVKGNFQEVGTVRLEVCVDRNGKVISAKQKLSGSTTQSSTLRKLAIANAKKYRFSKSELDNQCGQITYRFKLQ